jgi:hypothetical protein
MITRKQNLLGSIVVAVDVDAVPSNRAGDITPLLIKRSTMSAPIASSSAPPTRKSAGGAISSSEKAAW